MDSLANNPLLQPAYVNKVLDAIIPDTADYALTRDIPMVTQDTEMVVVDVRQQIGGMTMAVAEGAESPVIDQRGAHQYAFMPAHFREKVLLSEKDTKVIRRLGTASELERAAERVARIVGELRMRLETRMEWAKWQMLYGSLTVDQPDINYTIDYHVPTHFKPTLTGTDLWSDPASDPMQDWLDWLELYRDEGTIPQYFQYNASVEKALLLNQTVRQLRDSLFSGQSNPAQLSRSNIMQIFNAYTGMPVQIYDKGYFFIEGTTSALAPAGTSVTVAENPGFAIGDVVTLVHKNGERAGRVRLTLTGVVGVTLSFAALTGTVTFPVGSEIRVKKHFLADDKFIIRGALPAGTTGGQNWAEFVSTPHVYGPGGLMNPAPGVFMKTVIKDNDDPPRAMIISGVSGLPVMYHTTVNVIATVL
jgi:hypothetical protein